MIGSADIGHEVLDAEVVCQDGLGLFQTTFLAEPYQLVDVPVARTGTEAVELHRILPIDVHAERWFGVHVEGAVSRVPIFAGRLEFDTEKLLGKIDDGLDELGRLQILVGEFF